ncbi:proprotein convertase P-domain-containing protein, partial [Dolichospermum sp. ST_sed1]|nr:proprotein convertase P-domain-containing protein [Dolichospermum sp. ST_sed1]
LPTKIANDAQVINNEELFYFETNTDSYSGNSGSAVFNATTGEVEGLLVRGVDDFYSPEGRECKISIKLPHTKGRERVVRASRFSSVIAEANVVLDANKQISLFNQETIDIPDFSNDGVIQNFSVTEDKTIQTVRLSADITHPYSNDVEIYLITPNGQQLLVQLGSVGSAIDLKKTYFVAGLKDTSSKGLWQIKVRDISEGDVGFINSLKLDLYY